MHRLLPDGFDDLAGGEYRADRLITAAQPLCDRLDIGRDPFLLPGMKRAGAADAAHHFIQDQERAMLVADFAHGTEIAVRRRDRARGGADHRLGDEGRDRIGAEPLEFGIELGGKARDEIRLRLVVALLVIGEGRRDMAEGGRQQRRIGLAPPRVAARRQRAERIAVIALPPRDEAHALRLAGLDKILSSDLDRGLDRLRSTADEIDIGQSAGLVANERIGKRLRGFGSEEGGVGIGELRGLFGHRREHARMLMAETGHRGAAGGVEHLPAVLTDQPDALPADRFGRRLTQASVQHAAGGHDHQPFSMTYCDIAVRRASVSSRRFLAPVPPSAKVTAASDCAMAIAPVRLGKNPGEDAAS